MKATLIMEINSHPCNEYTIKNYKHQGLKCRQCHVRNVPDVIYFGQEIKNNLTKNITNYINDSMNFL